MKIRPANIEDLSMILKIENLSFSSPWTETHFQYELKQNPYAFVFVAEAEGCAVGCVIAKGFKAGWCAGTIIGDAAEFRVAIRG